MSSEEANSLKEFAHKIHDANYNDEIIFGNEAIRETLRRTGQWNLNYGGMYRALQYPKLEKLLSRPEITQRIASLLGNDLICWRSQFFEKPPGAKGTFWHQQGRFRELSKKPKLIAPAGVDDAMVQLTAWVALTDSTAVSYTHLTLPTIYSV